MNAPLVTGFRALLGLLEQGSEPVLHARAWEARLGKSTVDTLLRLGLLVDQGVADWYPCGGARGGGCHRRVVPNHGNATHPFVAVCGRDDSSCESVYLIEAELQLLGFSMEAFVHRLRRAFGLSGAVDDVDAGFPEARRIGDLQGRPVFFATSPGLHGFEAWLGARGNALVLIPEGRWLSTVTRDRFSAGQRTELVVLSEVLEFVGGVLVVKVPPSGNWQVNETVTPSYVLREPAVCVVHDNEGRRELTARQYQELVAGVEGYDLFVDMTVTVEGGGCRGGRRNGDGEYGDVVLTKHEAAAIAELVTTQRALRAGDFKTVTLNDVARLIERARKKLDVRVSRYEWRAIHTLAGDVPEAKWWHFRPGEGVRWGIVVPVVPEMGASVRANMGS